MKDPAPFRVRLRRSEAIAWVLAKNGTIADGATFPSSAHKNPTLTLMALDWRACDRPREELRKGNL